MAKTFKNLPRPSEATAPKPTSERDFFDLSDDIEPIKKAATSPEKDNIIGNTGNTNNTGNINNIQKTVPPVSASAVAANSTPASVRQTFVLNRGHLEQLRDYVHARRAQGDYTYSQKQALQDALDLLFAGAPPTAPRPAEARQQEQQRRQRIKRGQQGNSEE